MCIVCMVSAGCGRESDNRKKTDAETGSGPLRKEAFDVPEQKAEQQAGPEKRNEKADQKKAGDEADIQNIVVTVDESGRACIGDVPFSRNTLIETAEHQDEDSSLRPVRVVIQAHKDAGYEAVEGIMQVCAQNGIPRISFGTHKVDLPVDTGRCSVLTSPDKPETAVPFNIYFTAADGNIRFQEKARGVSNFDEFEEMLKTCSSKGKEAEVTVTCGKGVPFKYVLFVVNMAKKYGVSRIRFGSSGGIN